MVNFPEGTETPFARAVSAEIRGVLAARRLTLRDLAAGAGFKSHNYVAIRLRDEKPFTLDDVERIVEYLEEDDAVEFIKRAYANHDERLWIEASELEKARNQEVDVRVDFRLGDGTVVQVKSGDHAEVRRPGIVVPDYLNAEVIAFIRSRWAEMFRAELHDLDKMAPMPNTVEELLEMAKAAEESEVRSVVNARLQQQNRDQFSSFDEQEAARNEDREKPRMD